MATMAEPLMVRMLIVSRDIEAISVLCHQMQRMTMHAEICQDIATALRKICHAKFEGVVVDFTANTEALEFMNKLHESTSHRQAITFAILSNSADMRLGAAAGAHFVLKRPLLAVELYRTLKASYPLMVRERRRCFRCPLSLPVSISRVALPEFFAVSINISEGGMALEISTPLQVGEPLKLHFQLPGQNDPLTMTAEVCWTKSDQAGVQFCRLPSSTLEQLQSWLSKRLQDNLPTIDFASQKERG